MNNILEPFKKLYSYFVYYNKEQVTDNKQNNDIFIKETITELIKNVDIKVEEKQNNDIFIKETITELIKNVDIKVEEKQNNKIYIKELLKTCETGDIILFQGNSIISEIIKISTNSVWTHIGIIIKNPTFIKNCKKGIYLYVADGAYEIDKPSNKKLIGVQLVNLIDKLNNYDGTFYYRKLETQKNKKKMMNIFNIVYNTEFHKFYDWLPKDWIATFLAMHNLEKISDIISNPRHLDKMFCSSLVAYTYTQWKLLNKNTEWSFTTPEFFAEITTLNNDSFLQPIKQIYL
jgi:hypothetical protein